VPGLRFGDRGWSQAPFGLVEEVEGLAFVGVPVQVGLTSTLLGDAGRDAAIVVDRLAQQGISSPVTAAEGGRVLLLLCHRPWVGHSGCLVSVRRQSG